MRSESTDRQATPLLVGHLADAANRVVDEIVETLAELPPEGVDHASLYDGAAGLAVLWTSLGALRATSTYDALAAAWLDRAADLLGQEPMSPSVWEGFAGVGWAFEIAGRGDDADAVDDGLAELLSADAWHGDYDLVRGLVGFGLYALDRGARPAARRAADRVVALLAALATREPDGLTWYTNMALVPENERRSEREVDLGIAHGVAGAITFLARYVVARGGGDVAERTLRDAVRWLDARRLPDGGETRFPVKHVPGHAPESGRNAWCYGDLGIASALLDAAEALDDRRLREDAVATLVRASQRPMEQWRVEDVSLCHGAAGAAHLFHRFHRRTGLAAFADVARAWCERTLTMRRPGTGLAGFTRMKRVFPDPAVVFVPEPGLLMGVAGVALSLASMLSPVAPDWDRLLALNPPR